MIIIVTAIISSTRFVSLSLLLSLVLSLLEVVVVVVVAVSVAVAVAVVIVVRRLPGEVELHDLGGRVEEPGSGEFREPGF